MTPNKYPKIDLNEHSCECGAIRDEAQLLSSPNLPELWTLKDQAASAITEHPLIICYQFKILDSKISPTISRNRRASAMCSTPLTRDHRRKRKKVSSFLLLCTFLRELEGGEYFLHERVRRDNAAAKQLMSVLINQKSCRGHNACSMQLASSPMTLLKELIITNMCSEKVTSWKICLVLSISCKGDRNFACFWRIWVQ